MYVTVNMHSVCTVYMHNILLYDFLILLIKTRVIKSMWIWKSSINRKVPSNTAIELNLITCQCEFTKYGAGGLRQAMVAYTLTVWLTTLHKVIASQLWIVNCIHVFVDSSVFCKQNTLVQSRWEERLLNGHSSMKTALGRLRLTTSMSCGVHCFIKHWFLWWIIKYIFRFYWLFCFFPVV